MKKQKVIAIWLANFKTENELRQNYLDIDYEDDDANSQFGNDIGVDYYDEDFMESWWFESLDLEILKTHSNVLLHADIFYADFLAKLNSKELEAYNTLIFMFGEQGDNSVNEFLFKSDNFPKKTSSIQFIYKKRL